MSNNGLYYIYIDTKIKGAFEQLIRYFQSQVFNNDDCISVFCKYYKEIDGLAIEMFNKYDIPFKFIKKNSDLSFINGKIVFYLFNAQSNCRVVANRDLIHIFVTHGESHKLASVKPIIRIYDYVITSGDVGVDRYLKSGIFTQFDISNGKVLKLGDTFIGSNIFRYESHSHSLVYAPTWEGGVPEENYCSISILTAKDIVEFCKKNNIKKIFVQPHPNLGHRDIKYRHYLNECIRFFLKAQLTVFWVENDFIQKYYHFIFLKGRKKKVKNIGVSFAITDISAMEIQFHSRRIPCGVVLKKELPGEIYIPKKIIQFYNGNFFDTFKFDLNNSSYHNDIINYLISYSCPELKNKTYSERIKWLCGYVHEDKKIKMKQLELLY
ncbi:hypothetical protein G893_03410 [Escherichia coli KOEGE 71 (186a)]|uniref:hypothetical protein n=1 Tax=Escherichia coli TaxID=562 RepID=UPI0003911D29|nr:hypothetical protein [Escherichia coli]EQV89335.1 hypothetical protein G893_03410 [Escherichia coli KOEGE 71 (186a)]